MGKIIRRYARRSKANRINLNSQKRKKFLQPANSPADRILSLQRTIGNQAVQRLIESGALQAKPGIISEKNVDGGEQKRFGLIMENNGKGGVPKNAGPAAKTPKKKKAGLDSFVTNWKKNASAGPTNATLRLDYSAKFKKDADHDPALAEFRQNVMTKYEITDGPHKGTKGDTSPMHDDNYSRADDTAGNTINDVNFVSNDNPGFAIILDRNDVVNYSFTAEQRIIDTSDGNKVIAKRGPHTATIVGKHPRAYGDVPKTLS